MSDETPEARRRRSIAAQGGVVRKLMPLIQAAVESTEIGEDRVEEDSRTEAPIARSRTGEARGKREQRDAGMPNFGLLLELSGLKKARQVYSGGGWHLWLALEQPAASLKTSNVLALSLFDPEQVRGLKALIQEIDNSYSDFSRLIVVIKDSALRQDVTKRWRLSLEAEYSSRLEFITVSGLTAYARNRSLPETRLKVSTPEYFVEPWLMTPTGAKVRAIDELRAAHSSGRVVVLIAAGGNGKTTLLEAFVAALQRELISSQPQNERTEYPLLVRATAVRALQESSHSVTLESVLVSALREHGFDDPRIEMIDALVPNGGLSLIYDSFDETVSGRGVSANEVCQRMIDVCSVDGSQAQIMLATREDYWRLVSPEIREKCTEYRLLSFDDDQLGEYLQSRFASAKLRQRAETLLQKVGDLRYLPLVLDRLCSDLQTSRDSDEEIAIQIRQINRDNPLAGVCRWICHREHSEKRYPLSTDDQLVGLANAYAVFGGTLSQEDLLLALGGPPLEEHARILRHPLLVDAKELGDDSVGGWAFKFPEMMRAVIAAEIVKSLVSRARHQAGQKAQLAPELSEMMIFAARDADVLKLAGSEFADPRIGVSVEELAAIWEFRNGHEAVPTVPLFRILVDAMLARKKTAPGFLPLVAGSRFAHDFEFSGILTGLDLTGTVFENVLFRDARIENCVFPQALEVFRKCTFVSSEIGRGCSNLSDATLLECRFDARTIELSSEWAILANDLDAFLNGALKRVIGILLESMPNVRRSSAFVTDTSAWRTPVDEFVFQELVRLKICDANRVIERDEASGAERFVRYDDDKAKWIRVARTNARRALPRLWHRGGTEVSSIRS